jgi:hypothetical protein
MNDVLFLILLILATLATFAAEIIQYRRGNHVGPD